VLDDEEAADDIVVDPRDIMRLLLAGDESKRELLLERYGGSGQVEKDIITELSNTRVLADVAGFENVHRLALHSIEVLNRNGGRPARMPRMAIVKPIASGLVSVLLGFIIRNYRNTLTRQIRRLYERRFSVAASGSVERALLLRARNDITVVDDGFSGGAAGVPAFLVGGALLSTVFATIESTFLAIFHTPVGVSIVSVIAVLLLILLAWSAMYAAAVARRRIRLSTQLPARGLWDAVGFCGEPPKDQSFLFAVIAIVLAVLAWVLVPVVAYAIFS
jgi:hypothetical protein